MRGLIKTRQAAGACDIINDAILQETFFKSKRTRERVYESLGVLSEYAQPCTFEDELTSSAECDEELRPTWEKMRTIWREARKDAIFLMGDCEFWKEMRGKYGEDLCEEAQCCIEEFAQYEENISTQINNLDQLFHLSSEELGENNPTTEKIPNRIYLYFKDNESCEDYFAWDKPTTDPKDWGKRYNIFGKKKKDLTKGDYKILFDYLKNRFPAIHHSQTGNKDNDSKKDLDRFRRGIS